MQCTATDLLAADDCFDAIQRQGDGAGGSEVRTIREVSDYLLSRGDIPLAKIPQVLLALDVNGDGVLDREEWRRGWGDIVPKEVGTHIPTESAGVEPTDRGAGGVEATDQGACEVEPTELITEHSEQPEQPDEPRTEQPELGISSRCVVLKDGEGPIGVNLNGASPHPSVVSIQPGSTAARSVPPLTVGMRILSVNGARVTGAKAAAGFIAARGKGELVLEVESGCQTAVHRSSVLGRLVRWG